MPVVQGAEYLVQHLNNLGWCGSSGMGMTPLSFTEIKAYIDVTKASLTPDEVLLIKRMSQLYVGYSQDTNPSQKTPYSLPK
jgi:hypothetical protein